MRDKWPTWVAPALALGLVAMGLYAYNEQSQHAAAMVRLESGYQAAFHGLAFDVDEMQDALARALASTDGGVAAHELQLAGHDAATAQADAGRLPASALPGGLLQTALKRAAEITDALVVRAASGKALTTADRSQLRILYEGATRLEGQLRAVQGTIWNGHYSFLPVERLARAGTWARSELGAGMARVEHASAAMVASLSFTDLVENKTTAGRSAVISESRAVVIARAFIGASPNRRVSVKTTALGGLAPALLVSFAPSANGKDASHVAIARRSGEVLWMTGPASGRGSRLDLAQAQSVAGTFLSRRLRGDFALMDAWQFDAQGDYRFAPMRSGVVYDVHPVLIKVDLGSGRVIGYDAAAYLSSPLPVVGLRPTVSARQAEAALPTEMKIAGSRLAVVDSVYQHSVLVYDFLGHMNGSTFRVFVDAHTGKEVGIQKLTKAEAALVVR